MLEYKKLGFVFDPFDCMCGRVCYKLVDIEITKIIRSIKDLPEEFNYLIVDNKKEVLTIIPERNFKWMNAVKPSL